MRFDECVNDGFDNQIFVHHLQTSVALFFPSDDGSVTVNALLGHNVDDEEGLRSHHKTCEENVIIQFW